MIELAEYLIQGSLTIDFAKVVKANGESKAIDQILKLISTLDESMGVKFYSLEGENGNLIIDEIRTDGEFVIEEVDEDTPKRYKNSHQIDGLVTKS